MLNIFLTIGIVAYLLIALAWALFIRKLGKTRIRFFCVLASFAVSLIVTFIVKAQFLNDQTVMNDLIPWISQQFSPEFADLLAQSPTLREVVMGCASAIAAPVLMLAFFIVASFISWIVYLLITLIRGQTIKQKDEEAPFAMGRSAILTVARVLIVLIVVMVPIVAYAEVVPTVADEIKKAEILQTPVQDTVNVVVDDYVKPLNDNPVVVTFRTLGVGALSDTMTSFNVKGRVAYLKNEVGVVSSLACDVISLTKKDFKQYGAAEADIVTTIAEAFKDSEMLPTIGGEIVYCATDAWLNGNSFLKIPAETIYFDKSGMFDDFITALMNILHTDAKDSTAFCNDLSTVAKMLTMLIDSDVLAKLDDQKQLVDTFSEGGLVKDLVSTLGANASMKLLIPEVTNLGVRAIGTSLGIKEDAGVAYQEFLDTVSNELNEIKNMDNSKQVEVLSGTLSTALNNAGMVVDSEVLDCYSVSIIDGLINNADGAEITPENVQAFFAVYAWSTQNYESEMAAQAKLDTTVPLAQATYSFDILKPLLIGTIYENMSENELRASSAAVLARVTVQLSNLVADEDLEEEDENSIQNQAKAIITAEFSAILEDDGEDVFAEIVAKVTLNEPLSRTTINSTASLQKVETMKDTTVLVTLDKLLVDTGAAADKLTEETLEKEAEAISNIFSTASTLIEQSEDALDITTMAGTVGSILDSLSNTASFGKEQTANLFTAVLQSETVRKTANMDINTATQIAQKGSSGDAKYEDTFNTVSDTVVVMGALGADGEPLNDEEIIKLIRGINPQTAGMIEVYVTRKTLTGVYAVPDQYARYAAPLVSNLFGYMADADMDDAQYESEATAINNILTLIIAVSENANDENHNKTLFGETGILESADKTIEVLMSSDALAHSLRETLIKKDKTFVTDPFELSEMVEQSEETDEAKEIEDAIHDYYNREGDRTPEEKEEEKLTLELIGALFGIPVEDIDDAIRD